jgi:endonuclease/exonuclease/phosphatase family metal-dependent hydrolase
MGDFNDEPFDTSLVRHALSTRQRVKVANARENPLLWNLMWPNAGLPDGSFYFDNQPHMLDQFLVNKKMATADALIKVNPDTAQILKPAAMVDPGDYPKPIPYGGMGDPVNPNGFSDHFPITMTITEDE